MRRAVRLTFIFLACFSYRILAAPAAPKVGDRAPDFTLDGLDGKPLTLSSVTKGRPVVLVVLRGWPGYQCPICTKQVGEYLGRAKEFEAANAGVILVYPGPAENLKAHADEFVSGKSIPGGFRFVIDPDYRMVNAYGLRWDAPRETAYPSTFVIDTTGTIRYAHTSTSHGDRAPAKEVLKALAELKDGK